MGNCFFELLRNVFSNLLGLAQLLKQKQTTWTFFFHNDVDFITNCIIIMLKEMIINESKKWFWSKNSVLLKTRSFVTEMSNGVKYSINIVQDVSTERCFFANGFHLWQARNLMRKLQREKIAKWKTVNMYQAMLQEITTLRDCILFSLSTWDFINYYYVQRNARTE